MPFYRMYSGYIYHTRYLPVVHQLAYKHAWLACDVSDGMPANTKLGYGLSFNPYRHGDLSNQLYTWVLKQLAQQEVTDIQRIELHTLPCLFNRVFNPVSFYLAFNAQQQLVGLIAEVHNTFRQQHSYVLAYKVPHSEKKVFHVSPFFQIEGAYQFLVDTGSELSIRIEYYKQSAHPPSSLRYFSALMQGQLTELKPRALIITISMALYRIHWHALVLFFKRVPFFGKNGTGQQNSNNR